MATTLYFPLIKSCMTGSVSWIALGLYIHSSKYIPEEYLIIIEITCIFMKLISYLLAVICNCFD